MDKKGSTFQDLFYLSPGWLRNLATTLSERSKRNERFGPWYRTHDAFLRQSCTWPEEKLVAHQLEKTRRFLAFVGEHSPWYRELFRSLDFSPSALQSIRDLQSIPVMTKKVIRSEYERIRVPDTGNYPLAWRHTSGTTGAGLRFPETINTIQEYYALRALQFRWATGMAPGKYRMAVIAGHPVAGPGQKKPPYWVTDHLNGTLFFSSYHLSDATAGYYINALEKFRPTLLLGYPSAIYLLASMYRKRNRQFHIPAVLTSSESLLLTQEKSFGEVFGAKTFDFYGNTEKCGYILTCPEGRRHLLHQSGMVELNGEQMVVTNLANHAMPFVRYTTGDRIIRSENQRCGCGNNGILIDEIAGRSEDYIVTAEGYRIGRLDHLFKDASHVLEAQIVQKRAGEVILRIVKDPGYGAAEEALIRQEAVKRLGKNTLIEFDYTASIPREASGKFRFIVTTIGQDAV